MLQCEDIHQNTPEFDSICAK